MVPKGYNVIGVYRWILTKFELYVIHLRSHHSHETLSIVNFATEPLVLSLYRIFAFGVLCACKQCIICIFISIFKEPL